MIYYRKEKLNAFLNRNISVQLNEKKIYRAHIAK
jgi:hypothetical protein